MKKVHLIKRKRGTQMNINHLLEHEEDLKKRLALVQKQVKEIRDQCKHPNGVAITAGAHFIRDNAHHCPDCKDMYFPKN
jgi:hypothetical protein